MKKELPIKGTGELLSIIESNETIFDMRFLDIKGNVIASYFNAKEPTEKDLPAINRLINELKKAKSDDAFIRAFGKKPIPHFSTATERDLDDPLDISAIEFCFFHKNSQDSMNDKPYQWYRVIGGDIILQILDTEDPEDGKCLLEVLHPSKESVVRKLPETGLGLPDYLIIKKLFIKLDLNRKASCSEVLLTLERAYDSESKNTKAHFGDILGGE
ncbi:MAG: hypothetical protein AAB681_01465 [Patescibacteria group bacterium]